MSNWWLGESTMEDRNDEKRKQKVAKIVCDSSFTPFSGEIGMLCLWRKRKKWTRRKSSTKL